MKSKMKFRFNKNIAIAIALVLVFLIVPFHQTKAFELFSISNVATSLIGKVAYVINYIIGYIGGVLFSIGGLLINFALELNDRILDESFNTFLYTGWNIVLGFANLSFILVIIIIAFATIFRNQTYGMKQILWRLIVAALLVNFSLVIAGVFIDSAGMVTKFFVSKSTLGPTDMSTTLASVFEVQKFMQVQPDQSVANAFESFGSGVLIAISSVFFSFIFTVIASIVLLAIFVMLLTRYLALSILLIFSPLVMVAWIFPKSKYYQEWWQNFIKWTIFAPIVTFFLYLSITALQKHPAELINLANNPAQAAITKNGFLFAVSTIGQMVLAIGMLVASLFAAQKLGIAGGKAAYGAAMGTAKGFGGWIGRRGVRTGGYAFSPASERMKKWSQDTGTSALSKVKRGIGKLRISSADLIDKTAKSKIPGLKQVGKGMQTFGGAFRAKGEHKGFAGSVWGGMKSGSGLFKKPKKSKFILPSGETIQLEEAPEETKKDEEKPKEETKA